MDLDFDPIVKVNDDQFMEINFEFDDTEREFLRELAEAIPEESKLDSSKAVGVRSSMTDD